MDFGFEITLVGPQYLDESWMATGGGRFAFGHTAAEARRSLLITLLG